VPLVPDDPRLVDLVRLVKSGIAETIIVEQVRQDGRPYNLSTNDLLYLKQNSIAESTIVALMATSTGTPPGPAVAGANAAQAAVIFEDLVMKTSFMQKNRPGRLVLRGDSLAWTDGNNPKDNFEFKVTGLEKVWFTCQARTPENFCYQINFQVVKGGRYRFQDLNRESGSNAAVTKVMDAMRSYFPQITYAPPES
jgi:hypothetical protein